jgi:hypothetical protein
MAAMAREHWKANYPETYRKMKKRNDLVKESEAAARLTQREIDTLMKGGATEPEAWEASMSLFIFSDPAQDYNPD